MDYLYALLAGLIQGLTEFLPVSSSGHLIIFHDLFHFKFFDNLLFDVAMHLATFLALVIFFYKDVEKIIRGFLSSLFNWNWSNNYNQRLAWLVIIGTIPAVIVGYLFENYITDYLRSPLVVAVMLIIVAVLFWLAEKYAVKSREITQLNKADAFLMGLAQAVALIPGTSRSGITIITGLWRKLKREEAAKFSFLLSLPVILGASLKKITEINDFSQAQWLVLLTGFLTAFASGYFSIKYLLKYLNRHSLAVFAWYRLIFGALIILWLIFFK